MSTVVGGDKLRRAMAETTGDIRAGIRSAVADTLDAIRDDARRQVPVDTGQLRDSLETMSHSGGMGGAVGAFGSAYAPFVEFGTSKMPARPYLLPAAERERQRLVRRLVDAVAVKLP